MRWRRWRTCSSRWRSARGWCTSDSLNTSELLRALRERKITIFCCVPQFFYLIHERVQKQVNEKGKLTQIRLSG